MEGKEAKDRPRRREKHRQTSDIVDYMRKNEGMTSTMAGSQREQLSSIENRW
jgi:hypothetical protein